MLSTRRNLLRHLSCASALSALPAHVLMGQALADQNEGMNVAAPLVDPSTYGFWSERVRDPHSARTRALDGGSAPRAVFVYYDKDETALLREAI